MLGGRPITAAPGWPVWEPAFRLGAPWVQVGSCCSPSRALGPWWVLNELGWAVTQELELEHRAAFSCPAQDGPAGPRKLFKLYQACVSGKMGLCVPHALLRPLQMLLLGPNIKRGTWLVTAESAPRSRGLAGCLLMGPQVDPKEASAWHDGRK